MGVQSVRAELKSSDGMDLYPCCYETYASKVVGGPMEINRLLVDLDDETCAKLTEISEQDGFICFYHSDEGRTWFSQHEDILNRAVRRMLGNIWRVGNEIAFISGHLDLTQEEFDEHYKPKIHEAIVRGHDFVVGDARGADNMAQQFLANHECKPRFIVYHMFDSPRHGAGYHTNGGFQTDAERDAKMTSISQYDIAWVRAGREKSGTAKNIARRNVT